MRTFTTIKGGRKLLISEARDRWFEESAVEKHTRLSRFYAINAFCFYLGGDCEELDWGDVKLAHLIDWQRQMLLLLEPSTANTRVAYIKAFAAYISDTWPEYRNPFKKVKLTKYDRFQPKGLEPAEVQCLMDAATRLVNRASQAVTEVEDEGQTAHSRRRRGQRYISYCSLRHGAPNRSGPETPTKAPRLSESSD